MTPFDVNSDAVRAAADVVDALEESGREVEVETVTVIPDGNVPDRHEVVVEVAFTVQSVDDLRDERVAVTSDHAEVTDAALIEAPDVSLISDGPVTGYADYQAEVVTNRDHGGH